MTGSEPHNPENNSQNWCCSAGEWINCADQLPPVESRSFNDMLEAAGYEMWTEVGEIYKVPLTLAVYTRAQEPCFLFDLEGPLSLVFNLGRSPDLLILVRSRDSRAAVLHASRCRATSREGTAAGEESRR
ncbi:hypothetical protein ACFXOK_10410 [Streptomyces sp. NPDC059173]|uniref:hypothetical protein n=1 Tax=Streptomyces sp. NPDC059173 TaxID=3346756 RepID=UPI0036C1AC61